MSSVRSILRRLPATIAGSVLLIGSTFFAASPAQAVSHDAILLLKGAGNSYHLNPPVVVARAGASGQTLTYGVQVYNVGQTEAQFVLHLQQNGLDAEVGLYEGSVIRRLANTTDGYVTAPIAPGTGVTYTLKIQAYNMNVSTRNASVAVKLSARDGVVLGTGTARFEIKAPTTGTSTADVTARQGSQPYVGSRTDTQYTQSPYVAEGATSKFTIKQAVNAGSPHRVRTYIPLTDPACQSYTAKEGTRDVTAAVRAGTYYTKVLNPGQSVLLTVTYTKPSFQCGPQYLNVRGGAEGEAFSTTVVMVVP